MSYLYRWQLPHNSLCYNDQYLLQVLKQNIPLYFYIGDIITRGYNGCDCIIKTLYFVKVILYTYVIILFIFLRQT